MKPPSHSTITTSRERASSNALPITEWRKIGEKVRQFNQMIEHVSGSEYSEPLAVDFAITMKMMASSKTRFMIIV